MNRSTARGGNRLPMLDILRAIAVILVFGRHLMPLTNDGPRVVLRFANTWRRAAVGTDIFFVLSGFLVAGLLFRDFHRHGKLHIGNFLARRGFKIYPGYLLYLAASIPLAMLLGSEAPTAGQMTAHLFFVQNYYPHFLEYWIHLWSLAIEEHFYFGIAAMLFIAPRLMPRNANPFFWIPGTFVIVAVTTLAWRCEITMRHPFGYYSNFAPTHLRIDALLFGVLLSYYHHFHREAFVRHAMRCRTALWILGIAGLLPAFAIGQEKPFSYSVGFTLYYLATGAIVAAAVVTPLDPKRAIARVGTYLATRSYSIYLWHMLVFMGVRRFFIVYEPAIGTLWVIDTAITLSAALIVGIVMANISELPILRLRERWFPSPTSQARQTAAAENDDLQLAPAAS